MPRVPKLAVAAVALAVVPWSACSSDAPGSSGTTTTTTSKSAPTDCATTASPGRVEVDLRVDGRDRRYVRYVPEDLDPNRPVPLVMDLPAYAPASMEEAFSGFTRPDEDGRVLAEELGAVVVTPEPAGGDGSLLAWNLTDQTGPAWPDDHAFLARVAAEIRSELCVDEDRTLVMGFAIGGTMAAQAVCRGTLPATVLATVAGLYDPPSCPDGESVTVISFHGTSDRFVSYEGGIGTGVADLGLGPETTAGLVPLVDQLAGAEPASAAWAERNGCDATPEDTTEGRVTHRSWTGCDDGVTVDLYTIEGGEHTWPGSNGMGEFEALLGPVSDDVDANEHIAAALVPT